MPQGGHISPRMFIGCEKHGTEWAVEEATLGPSSLSDETMMMIDLGDTVTEVFFLLIKLSRWHYDPNFTAITDIAQTFYIYVTRHNLA